MSTPTGRAADEALNKMDKFGRFGRRTLLAAAAIGLILLSALVALVLAVLFNISALQQANTTLAHNTAGQVQQLKSQVAQTNDQLSRAHNAQDFLSSEVTQLTNELRAAGKVPVVGPFTIGTTPPSAILPGSSSTTSPPVTLPVPGGASAPSSPVPVPAPAPAPAPAPTPSPRPPPTTTPPPPPPIVSVGGGRCIVTLVPLHLCV